MPTRLKKRMTHNLQRVHVLEHAEVEHHDHADEELEEENELALGDEVRLAGLVNQLRDVEHRLVDRQVPQTRENHHPERQAKDADDEASHQQGAAVHAVKVDGSEIRENEIGLPARMAGSFLRRSGLRWSGLRCRGTRFLRRRRRLPRDRARSRRQSPRGGPAVSTTSLTLISSYRVVTSSDAAMEAAGSPAEKHASYHRRQAPIPRRRRRQTVLRVVSILARGRLQTAATAPTRARAAQTIRPCPTAVVPAAPSRR